MIDTLKRIEDKLDILLGSFGLEYPQTETGDRPATFTDQTLPSVTGAVATQAPNLWVVEETGEPDDV